MGTYWRGFDIGRADRLLLCRVDTRCLDRRCGLHLHLARLARLSTETIGASQQTLNTPFYYLNTLCLLADKKIDTIIDTIISYNNVSFCFTKRIIDTIIDTMSISKMEPMMPEDCRELADKAVDLIEKSSSFAGC